MSREITILAGDPGKERDAFGVVLIKIKNNDVVILGAERHQGIDYPIIEKWLASKYRELQPTFIVIEKNNTGVGVIDHLKHDYKVPIVSVVTSSYVKNEEKIHSGELMDKVEMSDFMLNLKQNHRIKFLKKSLASREILELKRQLETFAQFKTEAGRRSLRAPGQDHDDLVMALMLAIFIGRNYLEDTLSTYETVSMKFKGRKNEVDYYGDDDINRDIQSTGMSVHYP
jgi:hypothetical protein